MNTEHILSLARRCLLALALTTGLAGFTSCATRAQEGALIGGAGGAALGSVVADDAGEGALIGGAAGAVTGSVIGNSLAAGKTDTTASVLRVHD